MRATGPAQPVGWVRIALLLGGSGVLHFVVPRPFESIVPAYLGAPRAWVRVSGAAELACAVGLAVPATRRLAGLASAAVFVGVLPANVDMAWRALRSPTASPARRALLLARLPLQVPLVRRSLRVARWI